LNQADSLKGKSLFGVFFDLEIALGAAIDYLTNIGMDKIHDYEQELTAHLFRRLAEIPELTILGPQPKADGSGRAALASFTAGEVHPHDLSTILDDAGIAIRSGHHCTQPLHRILDISSTARASLYFYNTREEIDTFVAELKAAIAFFG
jgi:cysteine desulfurase / selenocysteine lyase